MILKVFACRDMKAQAFMQPFYSNSVGSALRAFGDACNETGSPFNKHPEDYVMYDIGTFDDATGLLVAITPIVMLSCASDFVNAMSYVKGSNLKGVDPKIVATELALEGINGISKA